ncbi:MAG: TIGR03087 family PEP-CTERM/XrtA system glycosyltransferase [Casimicrobiaceae bacterium]
MNILLLCHSFPFPPTSGDKIRSYNVIQHLAVRHQVTVATLARKPEHLKLAAEQRKNIRMVTAEVRDSLQTMRMIGRLPTATPSSFGFFYSRALARAVDRLLRNEKFDLIFVHCSSVARYVDHVDDIPRILDFADMDSQKWLDYGVHRQFPVSLGYRLEGIKLEREERRLAGLFDMCTVVTPAELATLDSYGAAKQTDWFPNGVDCEYFSPGDGQYDPNMIVFVGKMNYFPNEQCMIDFCRDTLPAIRRELPAARLAIVGSNPTRAVRALARLPSVSVTGAVDDVRPYLHRAAVAVAPLEVARGTQNKVLEAMAAGVPVVASALAARGVDAVVGEHLLVGKTPEEFAQAVLSIMRDRTYRTRLAQLGRQRMLSKHTWKHAMERLDEIVAKTLDLQSSPTCAGSRHDHAVVEQPSLDRVDAGTSGPQ